MPGLLDAIKNIKYNPSPLTMGLMTAGANILANSGPSRQRKSTGATLGQGLLGFIEGANSIRDYENEQQLLKLRRQMLEQSLADNGLDREIKQANLDKLKNPEHFVDPIGDFISTNGGQLVYGDRRTGTVKPVMLDNKWLKRASDDPVTQTMIAAGKTGQGGVTAEDPSGRKYIAPRYSVNDDFLNLLPNLLQTESSLNPNAVSPKGAKGLGQIMPETARDPGMGVAPMRDNSVKEQLRFSHDYLSSLVDYFGGDVPKAVSAYNAGMKTVQNKGITNPEYVNKVMSSKVMSPSTKDRAAMEEEGKIVGKDLGSAKVNAPGEIRAGKYMLSILDKLEKHKGMTGVVGMPSLYGALNVRGTPERDFETLRKQVVGKTFMEAYRSLKGGGQITEVEGQKATEALARLDAAQSEEAFHDAVQELRTITQEEMDAQAAKAGLKKPTAPPAGPPAEDFDSVLKFYSTPQK